MTCMQECAAGVESLKHFFSVMKPGFFYGSGAVTNLDDFTTTEPELPNPVHFTRSSSQNRSRSRENISLGAGAETGVRIAFWSRSRFKFARLCICVSRCLQRHTRSESQAPFTLPKSCASVSSASRQNGTEQKIKISRTRFSLVTTSTERRAARRAVGRRMRSGLFFSREAAMRAPLPPLGGPRTGTALGSQSPISPRKGGCALSVISYEMCETVSL